MFIPPHTHPRVHMLEGLPHRVAMLISSDLEKV